MSFIDEDWYGALAIGPFFALFVFLSISSLYTWLSSLSSENSNVGTASTTTTTATSSSSSSSSSSLAANGVETTRERLFDVYISKPSIYTACDSKFIPLAVQFNAFLFDQLQYKELPTSDSDDQSKPLCGALWLEFFKGTSRDVPLVAIMVPTGTFFMNYDKMCINFFAHLTVRRIRLTNPQDQHTMTCIFMAKLT